MKKSSVFMGLVLLAACTQLAQANIQISYTLDSAPGVVIVADETECDASTGDTTSCAAFTVGGATVEVLSANSNSPGTPGLAEQFGSTLFISTTTATDFTVWISASDFTAPTTPPSVTYESSLSNTSTTGVGSTSLESCIDTSNDLTPYNPANGTTGAGFANQSFCSSPAGTLSNAETYSGGSSNSGTVSSLITSLASPYSLSQQINFVLGAGSNLNVITSQSLTPVPEPTSIVLLGGVILLTSGAIRRRRKQQASRV